MECSRKDMEFLEQLLFRTQFFLNSVQDRNSNIVEIRALSDRVQSLSRQSRAGPTRTAALNRIIEKLEALREADAARTTVTLTAPDAVALRENVIALVTAINRMRGHAAPKPPA